MRSGASTSVHRERLAPVVPMFALVRTLSVHLCTAHPRLAERVRDVCVGRKRCWLCGDRARTAGRLTNIHCVADVAGGLRPGLTTGTSTFAESSSLRFLLLLQLRVAFMSHRPIEAGRETHLTPTATRRADLSSHGRPVINLVRGDPHSRPGSWLMPGSTPTVWSVGRSEVSAEVRSQRSELGEQRCHRRRGMQRSRC